jgi:hypothetical protein
MVNFAKNPKWIIIKLKQLIMKTKNLVYLLAFVCMAQSAVAQFGVHAGAVFSSSKLKADLGDFGDLSVNFDTKVGFMAGVYYRHSLGEKFALQPELNWMPKGGKLSEDGESATLALNYLELPVYFLFIPNTYSGFYAGAGPAFNFGISGKTKLDGGDDEDIVFGNDDDSDLKGFHMAVNFLAGYQLENGINLSAFAGPTITNSVPGEGSDEATWSFLNFGVRLGYTLGGASDRAQAKTKLKQVF